MDGDSSRFDCYEAAYKGALPRLKTVIDNYHKANKRDSHGDTSLHFASQGGKADCVQFLIEMGAEVNYQDTKGHSPLHKAAFEGEYECAKLLVDNGADVNLVDRTGASPLHYAALFGQKKAQAEGSNQTSCMVELFLSKGAYVDIRTDGGQFPLHYAAIGGSPTAVKALIAHGAAVNATDFEGTTALHRAAVVSGECTEILLDSGAIANVKDIDEATPLHHAAEGGCLAAIGLLVEKGNIPINSRDSENATPLHSAAFHGHLHCMKKLMELGASALLVDAKGNTPLHAVCFNGHDTCVEILVEYGKKLCSEYIHLQDSTGATALHKAAFKGRTQTAALLLKQGASLTLPDREGSLPFHKAAYNGHADCLKLLIEAKNNPLPPSLLKTPKATIKKQDFASKAKKKKLLASKIVVSDTFDINAGDKFMSTALHKAALRGNADCLSVLLEKGADYKVKDRQGGTPLHNAAQAGALQCVEILLKKEEDEYYAKTGLPRPIPVELSAKEKAKEKEKSGALPTKPSREVLTASVTLEGTNSLDTNGYSALHVAAGVGATGCGKLLIQKGAKVDERNKSGRTPLFYAILNGHEDMARLLIIDARADIDTVDSQTDKSLIDLQQFDARALSSEIILALVHERDNPVAERLDIEKLTPEQKKVLQQVIETFNQKPKKGIELLVKEKLVTDTPQSLAHFLFTTPQLDQEKVGDYMSDEDSYCSAILQAYVQLYDFKHLDFDMAIRRFVASSFKLPGEAQKIGRVMQAFARRYYTSNPNSVFVDEDAAFVMAFSAIMLNTDAHTAAVTKKMTLEEFLTSNRGINGGKDMPKEFMVHLYSRIVDDEIKMKSGLDKNTPWANADKQGYLYGQIGKKNWTNRWFVLKDSSLYYFKRKTDARPAGMIPIEELRVTPLEDRSKKKYQFQLRLKHKDPSQRAKTNTYTGKANNNVKAIYVELIMLAAPSKTEHSSWLSILKRNIHKFAKIAAANAKKGLQEKQKSIRQLEAAKAKQLKKSPALTKRTVGSLGRKGGSKAASASAAAATNSSPPIAPKNSPTTNQTTTTTSSTTSPTLAASDPKKGGVTEKASTLRPRSTSDKDGGSPKVIGGTTKETRPKKRAQTAKPGADPVAAAASNSSTAKGKSPRTTVKDITGRPKLGVRSSSSRLPKVEAGGTSPPVEREKTSPGSEKKEN